MRHDPRLWSPYRRAEDVQAAQTFAETLDDAHWEALLGPLVDAMLARQPAPELEARDLDPPISDALTRLRRLDSDRPSGNQETPADEVIGSRFGQLVARRVASEPPSRWFELGLTLIERYSAYLAFIEELPKRPDAAEAIVAAVGTGDLLEIVDTFGELRDRDNREHIVAETTMPVADSCPDRAQFVHVIDRYTSSASLRGKYLVASDLLVHLDPVRWMTWLQGHGFIVLAVALGLLGSLDAAIDVLDCVWEREAVEDLALTFLLRDAVGLMLRLDEAFRRASSSEIEKVAWNAERSAAVARVARLVGSGARPRVAADMLWGGWSDRRDASAIIDDLRTKTSEHLATTGVPFREVFSRLLQTEPHARALHAIGVLLWSANEEVRRELQPDALAAYVDWLDGDHCYWSQPLRGDDLDMTWRIAGIVAALEDPLTWYVGALRRIDGRPEGWNADYRKYLESLRSTAHLLTVGGMAAEWLHERRPRDSEPLYVETWTRLRAWLRAGADEIGDASAAVQQTWARASMILGDRANEMVCSAISGFDDFPLLVHAVRAYADNLRPSGARLAPGVVEAFRARRRELEALWRREAAREHDDPQSVVAVADALMV